MRPFVFPHQKVYFAEFIYFSRLSLSPISSDERTAGFVPVRTSTGTNRTSLGFAQTFDPKRLTSSYVDDEDLDEFETTLSETIKAHDEMFRPDELENNVRLMNSQLRHCEPYENVTIIGEAVKVQSERDTQQVKLSSTTCYI